MPISVRELLEAGAHFGHQTHRWNPKMRPYIFGSRNGIYIIDLQQTAKLWKKARQFIIDTVEHGRSVLFVGTKPQAQEVVREEASRANQLFVDRRWLGGMLTNFKTIKSRIERLEYLEKLKDSERGKSLTKKELVSAEKERQKLERSLGGIKDMSTLPGVVMLVDPNKEHIAVREARKLHIPIVAITDTNCDPDVIDYVVPANDDALKSIRLFLADAAEACLDGTKAFEARIQEETRKKIEAEKEEQTAEAAEAAEAAKAAEAATKKAESESTPSDATNTEPKALAATPEQS